MEDQWEYFITIANLHTIHENELLPLGKRGWELIHIVDSPGNSSAMVKGAKLIWKRKIPKTRR